MCPSHGYPPYPPGLPSQPPQYALAQQQLAVPPPAPVYSTTGATPLTGQPPPSFTPQIRQQLQPQMTAATSEPEPPPPPPPEPTSLMLLRLSNGKNTVKFSTAQIRVSLQTVCDALGLGSAGHIEVQPKGPQGPYDLGLDNRDLYERLVAEQEVDIYPALTEEAVETTFDVYQIDKHGRRASEAAIARVIRAREEKRAERDMIEKRQTVRIFIDGNTEMLALMNNLAERDKLATVAYNKLKSMMPIGVERSNSTLMKDEHEKHVNCNLVFVTLKSETSRTEWLRSLDWASIKYIVLSPEMNPVKVRLPADVCKEANLNPCCFRTKNIIDCSTTRTEDGTQCNARESVMRGITLPSTITDEWRSARAAAKSAQTRHRVHQREVDQGRMREFMSKKVCKDFERGRCVRHGEGRGGICIRGVHPEREVMPLCAKGAACYGKGATCLYSHPSEGAATSAEAGEAAPTSVDPATVSHATSEPAPEDQMHVDESAPQPGAEGP